MKLNVLVLTNYYSPSQQAGGLVRSLEALFLALDGDFVFWVLCRDRDISDKEVYSGIIVNKWLTYGNVNVMYLRDFDWNPLSLARIFSKLNFNLVYLNSFFSFRSTFPFLLLRRFSSSLSHCNVLLSPRGELNSGSMSTSSFKKLPYLLLSRFLSLYRGIHWHFSDVKEFNEATEFFPLQTRFSHCIPDLTPVDLLLSSPDLTESKRTHQKQFIFFSRIVPKKNLGFLLTALKSVRSSVILDIYGYIEDSHYWCQCLRIIATLPSNIVVNYCGSISSSEILTILPLYEVFLFPTLNENFGHVVIEALSCSLPIIMSQNTPWSFASESVVTLPLVHSIWAEHIDSFCGLKCSSKLLLKKQARHLAEVYLTGTDLYTRKTRDLFYSLASSCRQLKT
jgi:glycosyltransferase involved in cell wall biosynthesis